MVAIGINAKTKGFSQTVCDGKILDAGEGRIIDSVHIQLNPSQNLLI